MLCYNTNAWYLISLLETCLGPVMIIVKSVISLGLQNGDFLILSFFLNLIVVILLLERSFSD